MTEDLTFARQEGEKIAHVCGRAFLENVHLFDDEERCSRFFETTSRILNQSCDQIRAKGGSEEYVRAFNAAFRKTFLEEYVHGYAAGVVWSAQFFTRDNLLSSVRLPSIIN